MVFGRPGSGKSTFALKLHQSTSIPLHYLDKYFFSANWQERNYQEFLDIQQSIVDLPSWIIDGNNTKSLEMRYCKADLVLYFNYPRSICYLRVFKRLFDKNPEIKDRADGCKEKVSFSLLSYMWSFEKRVEDKIKNFQNKYPKARFIEIKSDEDLTILAKKMKLYNEF